VQGGEGGGPGWVAPQAGVGHRYCHDRHTRPERVAQDPVGCQKSVRGRWPAVIAGRT
jgi:hypothetical protein